MPFWLALLAVLAVSKDLEGSLLPTRFGPQGLSESRAVLEHLYLSRVLYTYVELEFEWICTVGGPFVGNPLSSMAFSSALLFTKPSLFCTASVWGQLKVHHGGKQRGSMERFTRTKERYSRCVPNDSLAFSVSVFGLHVTSNGVRKMGERQAVLELGTHFRTSLRMLSTYEALLRNPTVISRCSAEQ